MNDSERFWKNVRRGAGCWTWTGGTIKGGYGDFRVREEGRERHVIAHRFSWAEAHGSIPEGALVLHRCDNPPCVNPAHLFLGTHADNTADMIAKGRGPDLRGEKNHSAKLTPEQVREIRRLVNEEHQGRSEVGRRFGLHPKTVSEIARGTKWKVIPLESPAWTGHARRGRKRKPRDPAAPIRCGRCHEMKLPVEYPPSQAKRGYGYCKPCLRAYGLQRRAGG